jgi:hypothetical protein
LALEDVARIAWQTICDMKHRHVNEHLTQKYGFTTADVIQGYSQKNGQKFPIAAKEVVAEALESIARSPNRLGSDAVFGNGGILAGFDAKSGFQIYVFSMKEGFVEMSEIGYAALGSGGDTTNFVIPRLFNREGVQGRLTGIDRADGLCAVLDAVNMAAEHNLGVGGYFNILIFNANGFQNGKIYQEINDHRSKLSCEAVKAHRAGFVSEDACREIVDGLIFQGKDTDWGEDRVWSACSNPLAMHRLFRGYPVIA